MATGTCFMFLFNFLLFLATAGSMLVPLSPNCAVTPDIHNISFSAATNEVVIQMKESRRCDSPAFLLRLSGTAVYKLHPTQHEYVKYDASAKMRARKSIYHYKYPDILDTGVYFLEVLVLSCVRFDVDRLADYCLEDFGNQRNVANLSFKVHLTARAASDKHARWVHNATLSDVSMLHTRYQHRDCAGDTYCSPVPADVAPHKTYDYIGGADWVPLYRRVSAQIQKVAGKPPSMHLCYVGDSLSRGLVLEGRKLPGIDDNIKIRLMFVAFPRDINYDELAAMGCSHIVVAIGQWPAGYAELYSFSHTLYESDMDKVLLQLQEPRFKNSKVYVRSVHFTGIDALVMACPPLDLRSPPVIGMMNDILISLCVKYSIPYIDITHINAPLWDSAEDYTHPRGKVWVAEAAHVLHSLFAANLRDGDSTTLATHGVVPYLTEAEETIVYISGTENYKIVGYLYRDGMLHNIPDKATLSSLGNKAAVHKGSEVGPWYHYGADLPPVK